MSEADAYYHELSVPPHRPRWGCRPTFVLGTVGLGLVLVITSPLLLGVAPLLDLGRDMHCGAGGKILVTGYEPWGNMTSNPAEDVARGLHGRCVGGRYRIESWTLPVSEVGAQRTAEALTKSQHHAEWAAIIHLGFEHVAKGLKVELVASNVLALHATLAESGINSAAAVGDMNDSRSGRCSARRDAEIAADAPCLLATTAPLDVLALPLERGRYAAQEIWSRDAGTFYWCATARASQPSVPAKRPVDPWGLPLTLQHPRNLQCSQHATRRRPSQAHTGCMLATCSSCPLPFG
jgi:pyrrolidone-carboxylate peptidase